MTRCHEVHTRAQLIQVLCPYIFKTELNITIFFLKLAWLNYFVEVMKNELIGEGSTNVCPGLPFTGEAEGSSLSTLGLFPQLLKTSGEWFHTFAPLTWSGFSTQQDQGQCLRPHLGPLSHTLQGPFW